MRDLKQQEAVYADEDTWLYINGIPFQIQRRVSQNANEPKMKNPRKRK